MLKTSENEPRLVVIIDDHTLKFDVKDIARAMGCPFEYVRTEGSRSPIREAVAFHQIVAQMTGGKMGTGKSVTRAQLPMNLWPLYIIFHKNLYPMGHEQELQENFLDAIFAAHQGHWFNTPTLSWEGIKHAHSHTKPGAIPIPLPRLPYARLISKMIEQRIGHGGFQILGSEPLLTDNTRSYRLADLKLSFNHLQVSVHRKRERDIAQRVQDQPAHPSNQPPPQHEPSKTSC